MTSLRLVRAIGLFIFSSALGASQASAAITFDVAGLAGTGVTGQVTFAYQGLTNSTGTLNISIENTSNVGGWVSGFAFNVPTISGVSFISINGGTNAGGIRSVDSPGSSAVPENTSINQSGWFSRWAPNSIKTPNAAGDFDLGVLNNNNSNAFVTGGTGSGPRISNLTDGNDSTMFTLNLVGTGLQSLTNAAFEQAFLSELSTGAGFYNFGVRFQGIANDLSDFAVATTTTTTNPVPVPGAVLLGALGLGMVGFMNRNRK